MRVIDSFKNVGTEWYRWWRHGEPVFYDIRWLRVVIFTQPYDYDYQGYGEKFTLCHYWRKKPRWEFRLLWFEFRWRVHRGVPDSEYKTRH